MAIIENSVNYGALFAHGNTGGSRVGGIAGIVQSDGSVVHIENCVSVGAATSIDGDIDAVIGAVPSSSTLLRNIDIVKCVWTRSVGTNAGCGSCDDSRYSVINSFTVGENSTTVTALNEHASGDAGWNK